MQDTTQGLSNSPCWDFAAELDDLITGRSNGRAEEILENLWIDSHLTEIEIRVKWFQNRTQSSGLQMTHSFPITLMGSYIKLPLL